MKEAYALCCKTAPAEGTLFIANEQAFHNTKDLDIVVLFMFDGEKSRWVFTGPLATVMTRMKEFWPKGREVRLVYIPTMG